MADLTPIAITKVGADLSGLLVAADAAGDVVDASGSGLFFAIENGDVDALVVTVVPPVTETQSPKYGELPITDLVQNIPAGELWVFTIPIGYAVDNKFNLAYDDVSSVTVGAFSLA